MVYKIQANMSLVKFYGSSYDHSSTCERKSVLRTNTISPISIDKSTLGDVLDVGLHVIVRHNISKVGHSHLIDKYSRLQQNMSDSREFFRFPIKYRGRSLKKS